MLLAQGLFGGRLGIGELLIIGAVIVGIFIVTRPLRRLLWAIIHKLER